MWTTLNGMAFPRLYTFPTTCRVSLERRPFPRLSVAPVVVHPIRPQLSSGIVFFVRGCSNLINLYTYTKPGDLPAFVIDSGMFMT